MIQNIVTDTVVVNKYQSVNPAGTPASNVLTGAMDTNGLIDVTFLFTGHLENLVSPGITITKAYHSDSLTMQDKFEISADKIIGKLPFIITPPASRDNPNFIGTLGFVGTKRYIQIEYDSAGGGGNPVVFMIDLVGKPQFAPPAN